MNGHFQITKENTTTISPKLSSKHFHDQADHGPNSKTQKVDAAGAAFPFDQDEPERFGVILSRTCSSISHRYRSSERNHGGAGNLQGSLRRAFSMRKSSSLRDGYWRIHDTCDADDDDGYVENMQEQQQQQQQQEKKKKKAKIIRACKRFFGIK